MASKQAVASEALAAQIYGMSRSEMYDMMSKMKVRHPHAHAHPNPKPYRSPVPLSSPLLSSPLLCLSPPTRLFTDWLTVLLMFLCYAALAPRRP